MKPTGKITILSGLLAVAILPVSTAAQTPSCSHQPDQPGDHGAVTEARRQVLGPARRW